MDPEVQDTASSPLNGCHVNMQVDPSVRKRLAMELENLEKGNKSNPNYVGLLALTQGLGEEGARTSLLQAAQIVKELVLVLKEFLVTDRRPPSRRTAGRNEYSQLELSRFG